MQYKIKKGDTLSAISRKLGISIKDLATANKIKDVNKIQAGASLIIPQPKKKKSSSVERVKPQEKKETKPKKKTKKREPILPINVRQFLNPNQDRTEEDLSTEEKKALKEVIARSQTPERIAEKKAQGLDPNLIEYKDYATTSEGSQYADVDRTSDMSVGDLANKIQNPNYNLKTFLGQATAIPQEGGGYRVVDTFDFKPQTEATGLKKVKQYLGSIDDAGFNPYAQLRNFMGYYGPQEGTGQGGKSNINLSAQGGQTRYNFNKGGSMNIQQQTKNVAAQGRYGDSMLLHVNPAEVKGLAQAMPITVNPETGQPEAFLPFLAPLAGSLLGGSLLTGAGAGAFGGLIGGAGLSSLAAGAIGSGVAQYAVTGDLKKGLMAGLTGYGVGSALQGAGAAASSADKIAQTTATATDAATKAAMTDPNLITSAVSNVGPVAPTLNPTGALEVQKALAEAQPGIAQAGQTAATDYIGAAIDPTTGLYSRTGIDAAKDAFSGNTFGQGVGNVVQGLSQPGAYIPAGIGMGGTSIMESQELFAQQEADRLRRYNEDREEMYRNTPEPILYSANGGVTNFNRGGNIDGGNYTGGDLPQIYAPDRAAYQVNPDFMAGFAPETMYFNPATVSAPASNLGSRPVGGIDTYEGSKGGFGGMQASIAPTTSIDPYAAYSGQAPEGLQFTNAAPPPPVTPPIDGPPPPPPPDGPPIDYPPIDFPPIKFPPGFKFPPIEAIGDFPINLPGIGGIDFSGIDFSQFNPGVQEEIDTGVGQDFMIKPPVDVPVDYTIPNGSDFSIQRPDEMMFPGGSATFDESGGGLGGLFGGLNPTAPVLPTAPILDKPIISNPRDDFMSIDRLPMDFDERDFEQTIGRPPAPILGGNDFLPTPPSIMPAVQPEISGGFMPQPSPIMAQPMPVAPELAPIMQEPAAPLMPPVMKQPMPMPMPEAQIIPRMPNETSVPFVPPVSMPQPVMQQPMPAPISSIDERDFIDSIGITPPNVPQPIMQPPQMAQPMPQPIPQLAPEVLQQLPPEVIQQLMPAPSPVMMPAPSVNMGLPRTRMAGIRGRAEGGDTLPNKGLEALNKVAPQVVDAMGYEEGGMTDPLIAEVTEFILGTSDNSDALNAFVEKYGNEAFMQLREQILQSLVPNAQTEGQIQGDGNGGMDDDLFGRIGNQERIAVSQDEFIVPADVVSMLGDGSSDAGSKELYAMMDRVRREKTGTTKQAPRLANAGGMLPA